MKVGNAHRLPIIIIMLLIVGSLSVLAKSTAEVQIAEGGYINIEYPKFDYYPVGQEIDFRFYAFNSSAFVLTNTTTDCGFSVFNVSGDSLIFNVSLDYSLQKFEYFFDYTFENKGTYQGVVYCNNTMEAGFVSFSFDVTDGVLVDDLTPLAILILIPLIFGIILLFGAFSLNEKHAVIKIFLFFLSLLSLWSSLDIGLKTVIRYYNFNELQDSIGIFTLWSGYAFAVILIYFCIYLLWLLFVSIHKNKQEQLKY